LSVDSLSKRKSKDKTVNRRALAKKPNDSTARLQDPSGSPFVATDYPIIQSGKSNGGAKNPDEISLVTTSLVSIVVPCCGMLEYTKLCVPSVLKHSRSPFELIFLDIGSLDGTSEYLAGFATAHPSLRVEVVRTATDLGIKDACKEALARAHGEFLVLLNNDTVVTNGWLNQLTGLANMSPTIGAVGPMSNYAAPPQLVESVPYRVGPRKVGRLEGRHGASEVLVNVEAVNHFAGEFRSQNKGKWVETERLGGYCLLLKREMLQRVGSLDPWTDLSLFDTDIVSTKARQAGYTLAVCRDLFIHHFGTRTFAFGAPQIQSERASSALGLTSR
jgi:GT2 family glycosyltransferase